MAMMKQFAGVDLLGEMKENTRTLYCYIVVKYFYISLEEIFKRTNGILLLPSC
jgi:hypothetical protein